MILAAGVRWGTAGVGMRAVWHSAVSTFVVDGRGISPMGAHRDITGWVSLKTIDERRAYRPTRSGKMADPLNSTLQAALSGAEDDDIRRSDEDNDIRLPGDIRWPLHFMA